jgi:hypothetical protein
MPVSSYDELWEAYTRDFKKAFFQNDFEKSREVLNSAFSDAEELAEVDFRIVASTHCLASSYVQGNRQDEAKKLFLRFIELREKVLGPEDPDVADSLERIAISQWSEKKNKPLKKAI